MISEQQTVISINLTPALKDPAEFTGCWKNNICANGTKIIPVMTVCQVSFFCYGTEPIVSSAITPVH